MCEILGSFEQQKEKKIFKTNAYFFTITLNACSGTWHVSYFMCTPFFFNISHLTNELYRLWNIVNWWGDSD